MDAHLAWLAANASATADLATAHPVAAAVAAAFAACALITFLMFRPQKAARGFGSGENASWNRRIRTDRPAHVRKHHLLEKRWCVRGMWCGVTAGLQRTATVAGGAKRADWEGIRDTEPY